MRYSKPGFFRCKGACITYRSSLSPMQRPLYYIQKLIVSLAESFVLHTEANCLRCRELCITNKSSLSPVQRALYYKQKLLVSGAEGFVLQTEAYCSDKINLFIINSCCKPKACMQQLLLCASVYEAFIHSYFIWWIVLTTIQKVEH